MRTASDRRGVVRTEWFEGLQPETPDQAIKLGR